ncbi:MAG: hypothetical protein WD872_08245 [Pirellulaceae bacterium]
MMPARADEALSHEGVVVSVGPGTLSMVDTAGKDRAFLIDPGAKITIRGQPGKLEQLTPGLKIKLTTDKLRKAVAITTVDNDGGKPAG